MKKLTGEKQSLLILNKNVKFHPCSVGRDEFTPVQGGFMCASCNIKVLKAQEYRQSEILEKLAGKGKEHVCFRVTELHDGTILTKDTTLAVMIRELWIRAKRRFLWKRRLKSKL